MFSLSGVYCASASLGAWCLIYVVDPTIGRGLCAILRVTDHLCHNIIILAVAALLLCLTGS